MCIFNNIYIVNTLVMCTNDVNWITNYQIDNEIQSMHQGIHSK